MAAGPKPAADLSVLPFRSPKRGAERFAAWGSKYLIVPKGNGAGKPMRLRPWQVEMLHPFLEPGRGDKAVGTRQLVLLGGIGTWRGQVAGCATRWHTLVLPQGGVPCPPAS